MKAKRICACFLVLIMVCGILPCALAEQPESPAISVGDVKYLQDGFLYEPGDRSLVYYYDYGSGFRMPLCTRPNCDHQPLIGVGLFTYETVPELMKDKQSSCYAAKFAFASDLYGYTLYDNKLYFFPSFCPGAEPGTNTVPLYVSEVDGETRLITDLGYLFPGDVEPEVMETTAYDGYLYTAFRVRRILSPEEAESEEIFPEEIQLIKCSMTTGESSVLESFCAQSCELDFFGLFDGILYFKLSTADGMAPGQTQLDYMKDRRSKIRYSVLGINVKTGERVIPDQRLCDRNLNHGECFDIVRDEILYSIVLPASEEDPAALFLGYNLEKHENILEYAFTYDYETDFYPYRVLTDEIMLAFNYETGTFALRNLKNGEIIPLSFPGACINGNDGQTDWYDIFVKYFQTNPLVIDHCYSDGTTDKAYVTAEELLTGNPQIHDFTGQ